MDRIDSIRNYLKLERSTAGNNSIFTKKMDYFLKAPDVLFPGFQDNRPHQTGW